MQRWSRTVPWTSGRRGYNLPIKTGHQRSAINTTINDRGSDTSLPSVSSLRGAVVLVDARRATRFFISAILVVLTVLDVAFFVATVHSNAQITDLQHHGVSVVVTVTTCSGQLGGSGSNSAGYRCGGTFELGDHRYNVTIPEATFRATGTTVQLVAAKNNPELVATPEHVRSARASFNAFFLSALLFTGLVAIGFVIVRRRPREN